MLGLLKIKVLTQRILSQMHLIQQNAITGKQLANVFHKPHIRHNSKKDVKKSMFLRPKTSYEIKEIMENLKKNQPGLPQHQSCLKYLNKRTLGTCPNCFISKNILTIFFRAHEKCKIDTKQKRMERTRTFQYQTNTTFTCFWQKTRTLNIKSNFRIC